jgi:RNA polymerase sigma-70 factor (ECF subfamily)
MTAVLEVDVQLRQHRAELCAYCYRMLGTVQEAEDAVQETLFRAWRCAEQFEGRAAARTWLYRIATNVCLDMIKARSRRAVPIDTWDQPGTACPDADPAEQAMVRETVRLALVAAVQHLPARQRAVLMLRVVLRWKADEVAARLGTSVASVNSSMQRARATLEATDPDEAPAIEDQAGRELLARYVSAFDAHDAEALAAVSLADYSGGRSN